MSKLLVHSQIYPAGSNGIDGVVEVILNGFVDAANSARLEDSLQAVQQGGSRFILLNFGEVRYIDSDGAGVLIRNFERCRGAGGMLCLTHVSREVGLSLHLLGVTGLVPLLKDLEAAREHVEAMVSDPSQASRPQESHGSPGDPARSNGLRAAAAPAREGLSGLDGATVLVVVPKEGRFTRVLKLRCESLNGGYRLLHSAREALSCYDTMMPDVTVIHHRCDPRGELVRRIKIERGDRLTSVLKLYESEAAARRQPEFKICENDHLVEPFELLELFTLAEAELRRLSKDREVLSRQLHLKFVATPEGLGKAGKIVDAVLRQRFALQDDATAFFAAVKEAMDNAAVHGNRSDTARRVDLHLLVDQRKATVIVEDEGGGFDHEYYLSRLGDQETFERAKRRILEENERGGLGILLMAKCADRLEYSGKGNVVRLEKNL